jgi:hypothetical protein
MDQYPMQMNLMNDQQTTYQQWHPQTESTHLMSNQHTFTNVQSADFHNPIMQQPIQQQQQQITPQINYIEPASSALINHENGSTSDESEENGTNISNVSDSIFIRH